SVFGTGYFNPNSLIALRLLDPRPDAVLDAAFFAGRLARARTLRDAVYAKPFYRLVHAEGDFLPGLTIDRFDDVYSVQITTAGMEALREPLLEALGGAQVVLRADTPSRALEGLSSYVEGDVGRIAVEENGVRYFADLAGGQKT